MIQNITRLLLVLVVAVQYTFAQVEITGSTDYGRIFDLTYDANIPNKIYGITIGNHIVVSEDNGATWSIFYTLDLVDNALVSQLKLSADGTALTFLLYAPNSTENAVLVYDLTSETVVKMFPVPNQDDFAHVSSYDFYDGNMDVLIIDTNFPVGWDRESKVFYTADGGITWDMIYYTNDYDTVFLNDVAISPSDPDTVYLVRGNGSTDIDGGLFVSADAGLTYTVALSGNVLSTIAFDPSDDQTIYVGTGISFGETPENVFKSTDGGATFSAVPMPWTAGILENIVAIKFNENNPLQIIVLEENEIVISEDGGTTFVNYVYPYDNTDSYYYGLNASYNPNNSDEIVISSNYIPLFSNDGGETVSAIVSPYFASTGTNAIFSDGANSSLYYGVQHGMVHRDLSTGDDTPINLMPLNSFSTGGTSYFIDSYVANRMYSFSSSFIGSSFNISTDNGLTSTQLLSVYSNRVSALATYPSNTETILVAFAGYDPGETQFKKIDFSDLDAVVITDVSLPTLDYINSIIIDASGTITLPIGTEVYRSTDDGSTWEASTTGLEVLGDSDMIFDLQEDPLTPGTFTAATSIGIFMSEDSGVTWTQKSTKPVHKIAFSTETVGAMVATKYTGEFTVFELFSSTDYGETWDTIYNEQLLSIGSTSASYKFEDDAVTVYVGTYDLGLMEYTIDLEVLGTPDYTEDDQAMAVYPNPTSGLLHVDLKDAAVTQVAVYNVSGAKVMTFNGTETLDLSNLASGIYVLRIQDSNNVVGFKRIVKQ
ncbi:T9SS type A sorting domain-containing protein [Winogradskyella psychrotolerans]|uniref:T9SS type A sorting domain-containing protein n=1 Tax=Winogradskyella psychrotolerans TaxID=1344585 RepID=UPI001C067017|nr:T9SS type A sorting domain-containing protein [Winogradskyella psychrotolerans]MBU2929429.1 T9SS type A sorting domain-containing protein [Winogradskyella psychrotolerans]